MKRRMTISEWLRILYFAASLLLLCLLAESVPACIFAVINLAVAARVLRTVRIDEIVED